MFRAHVLIVRRPEFYHTAQYIYLNINQLDALNCIISLFHASTCFEHYVLIIRGSKLYYAASGIITPVGGRPVHRLREDWTLSTCLDGLGGRKISSPPGFDPGTSSP